MFIQEFTSCRNLNAVCAKAVVQTFTQPFDDRFEVLFRLEKDHAWSVAERSCLSQSHSVTVLSALIGSERSFGSWASALAASVFGLRGGTDLFG